MSYSLESFTSKEEISKAIEDANPEDDTEITEPSAEEETNLQEEQQPQESQEQTEPEEIYEEDSSSQTEQYGQERVYPNYEDITAFPYEETSTQEDVQENNQANKEIPLEDPSMPVLIEEDSGQIISAER